MKSGSRRSSIFFTAFATCALTVPCAATTPARAPRQERQQHQIARETSNASPREKRAQAYAKLLEGQRYLIGGGLTDATLRLAKQAFQQAVTLDPQLSEAHVGLADIAFFFSNDFEEAERQANAAIRANKNSFGGHRVLSRLLTFKSGLRENSIEREPAERAIAELREVVRLSAADAEGWALLGDLYLALGRQQEAITAYTNWESSPPPLDARVYQLLVQRELTPESAAARLSQAYLSSDRPADAYRAIRRAMSRDSDQAEYLGQLYDVVKAGGADKAEDLAELQRLAAASPENVALGRILAAAQLRANRADDAVATLRQAIARSSGKEQAVVAAALRKELARTLADATRYDEAAAVYEELAGGLGKDGNSLLTSEEEKREAAEVLTELLALQKRLGRTNDALATIARTRKLFGGDDPTADVQYIELLRDQSKRREALAAAQAALIKYPEQRALVWYQAAILADLGRVDEGVALLRSKLKNAPGDVLNYMQISALYSQAGRGAEAVEAARQAVAQAPAGNQNLQTRVLLSLSSAQEKAGDARGSEESLRRVLANEPNNAEALNNLGYFLVERNERLEEATEMIRRAVRSEPFNSSYLDSLGWAYYKLGKLDEAERYLSDAARRSSNSATIQEHLGDVFLKRGKLSQARLAWQKALELSVEAAETSRLRAKLNSGKK